MPFLERFTTWNAFIKRFYIATCRVYAVLFPFYWVGTGFTPLSDLFISIPWFIHLAPILGFGILYFLSTKKAPIFALALSFFFALPFIVHVQTPVFVTQEQEVIASSDTEHVLGESSELSFTVCSLNTYYYFNNLDRESALSELVEHKCDVYLLQEVWQAKLLRPYIEEELRLYFPGYNMEFEGEFITMSHFPIRNAELGRHEGFLKTDLEINNEVISFVNIHIWNPLTPRGCLSFTQKLYTEDCMLSSSFIRNQQLIELQNAISTSDNTAIIAGDFNSTEQMKIIQDMKRISQHVTSKTIGLNATFPAELPLMQIDHFFLYNGGISEIRAQPSDIVCNTEVSDHCMIKAKFTK